jgi:hypothetical protein
VVNYCPRLKSLTAIIIASCASVSGAFATDKNASFEGMISAILTRAGTETTQFVFTRKGNQLRIENTTNKLDAINIVDLATGRVRPNGGLEAKKLTIIYPHNTTFVRVDLTKKSAQPDAPPIPPGIPPPPTIPKSVGEAANASPARTFPGTTTSSPTGHVGPNISPPPGFASPPPMPSMPAIPNPAAAGPGMAMPMSPSLGSGAPGMPSMPTMFGAAELKKTDKIKKIQGFDCTLYTVSERGENFEIWATDDSALFPFRLIQRDYLERRFGPQMLEETWPELLQNKSLFPLEATLKMEPGGQERLSFKVDKIDKRKIDPAEADKLFAPPEKYIEIQAPQF